MDKQAKSRILILQPISETHLLEFYGIFTNKYRIKT